MTKIRMERVAQKPKLRGARGLIQRAREFRASNNKNYLEIALAAELEKVLDERDAMTREYYLRWDDDKSLYYGPIDDESIVDSILDHKTEEGYLMHKASRLVGEIK